MTLEYLERALLHLKENRLGFHTLSSDAFGLLYYHTIKRFQLTVPTNFNIDVAIETVRLARIVERLTK